MIVSREKLPDRRLDRIWLPLMQESPGLRVSSWLPRCGSDQVKFVLEMGARKKPGAFTPMKQRGQLLQGRHIPCHLSALACLKVSAEEFCARGVISSLLARCRMSSSSVQPLLRKSGTYRSREVAHTSCRPSNKTLSLGAGRTYTLRGQCASSKNSSVFVNEH